MQTGEWLAILNVLIAFLGVSFVILAVFEWSKLRELRKDMEQLEKRTLYTLHKSLKATHRVIASYQIKNPKDRITLLESAVAEDPQVFNGYNCIGYAWMELGETAKGLDAFTQAVHYHPEDKAGYCDLAYAHFIAKNESLAIKYFRKAIKLDPSTEEDIIADERLTEILDKII